MNRINKHFLKSALALCMVFLSGNLMAFESPEVPWRNIEAATQTSTFYFLSGLALFLLIMIIVLAGVLKSLVSNKELWLNKVGKDKAAGILILAFVLSSANLFAETAVAEAATPVIVMTEDIFFVLIAVNFVLLGILFAILLLIRNMVKSLRGEVEEEVSAVKQDIWTGALNDAVPVEREGEIMMDHEYDGIRELDNNLPPWWIYGFYGTIVFAVVYLGYYHVTGKGDLQIAQYEKQMEEGKRQKEEYLAKVAAKVDENSVVAFTDEAKLEKGKQIFMDFCAACHGRGGEGGVGPNFADEYWLHGGGIVNVFKTIKYGVPAKGMIAWESQLTPPQMQEVASYVLTLEGTNPANQKEPQGEIWVEEEVKTDSLAADTAKVAVAVIE